MTDLAAEQVVATLAGRAFVEVHLRKRYQCSTCGRSWSSKGRAVVHVRACAKDPGARGCGSCRHDMRANGYDQGDGCAEDARRPDETFRVGCEYWTPTR